MVNEVAADVPPPIPIEPSSKWIPVAGAIFGGVTLLGLLVLVRIASNDATFVCRTFLLLAMLFSLGSALAAGYIGGAAAFQGKFGEISEKQAIIITAGGGIGVL